MNRWLTFHAAATWLCIPGTTFKEQWDANYCGLQDVKTRLGRRGRPQLHSDCLWYWHRNGAAPESIADAEAQIVADRAAGMVPDFPAHVRGPEMVVVR